MPMPTVHFLNVGEGDCFLLERSSGRLTMIDICAGNIEKEEAPVEKAASDRGAKPRGNFGMCSTPINPIGYLQQRGLSNIWRFILTHPDMDHMDGIKRLFETMTVSNFWDCGVRRSKPDFEKGGRYLEEDWDFYEKLITRRDSGITVVSPRAGDRGKYWNADDDAGTGSGDYLHVVSPTQDLISSATESGDINDASYVVVYRSSAGPVIFSGDSNDKTWEYILANHKSIITDAAVLFAPHHGRKSERDYTFLDVVKPRISFFGCAESKDLAYSAWDYRKLLYFTSNQCGNVHIYPKDNKVEVFIENETYARAYAPTATHQEDGFWFLCSV